MTAAPMESCRFVARRSPWGRFGSAVVACKRLHRTRHRLQHILANSLSKASRYFLTVDWLLPVLDLIPSVAIRIKADAGIGEGESRRGMIADGIEAQTLEAVVDQAILVAVKLDADLSMWLRDYATAGADEGFPEITYLRHVTPHSRARVPSEEAWI